MTCGICKRTLDQPGDSDSIDCGGDCWGCVQEAENHAGGLPLVAASKSAPTPASKSPQWILIHEMDRGKITCSVCGHRGFVRSPAGSTYCGPCATAHGYGDRSR